MDKNPFSLFDFLGYFIPGAFATYLFVLLQEKTNKIYILNYFDLENLIDSNSIMTKEINLLSIIFYTITAYTLGHLLSYISTKLIENYTLYTYGYPSKLLLQNFMNKEDLKKKNKPFVNFCVNVLIFPIYLVDLFLKKQKGKISYQKSLGEPYEKFLTKKIIKIFRKFDKQYDLKKLSKDDFHQYFIYYCYENTKYHHNKLMNYVALYGFLRVITLILNFVSIYSIIISTYLIYNEYDFYNFYKTVILNIALVITTYLFFLSYLKFYKRYTKENLMLLLL